MKMAKPCVSTSEMARPPAYAEPNAKPRKQVHEYTAVHLLSRSTNEAAIFGRRKATKVFGLTVCDDNVKAVSVPELNDHADNAR